MEGIYKKVDTILERLGNLSVEGFGRMEEHALYNEFCGEVIRLRLRACKGLANEKLQIAKCRRAAKV